ncbi:MAG: dienelactone hydrolase family protein [Rubrivivax sp.]|nr:dienelactone hydrolase family protein [Rubrivivax sp.]
MHHKAIRVGRLDLPGELVLVPGALGLVVFVHGSGSSRLSPRNRLVAKILNDHHLATLLFDLLSDAEADDRRKVFDIELLAARVAEALAVLRLRDDSGHLRVGLFGASTGAAAALRAAAAHPGQVAAVVSRGGRPDLAAPVLDQVQAPTLLIVGGDDTDVLALNRDAASQMRCPHRLEVVAGATHLFEEPGALEVVAELAADWFSRYLAMGAGHEYAV